MATPANTRGWGKGWPQNNSSKMVTVRAARSGAKWPVHRDVAPILQHIVDEVERRGYLFHQPGQVVDDWGYANRPIRGTSTPSNHSWGLAVDVDATLYPQGQRSRRPPQWVIDLFAFFRWENGWQWRNPDPMHFEFAGTIAEARWLVAALAAHHLEQTAPPVPARTPTLAEVILFSRQLVLGADKENPPEAVKVLQGAINNWGDRLAAWAGQPNPPDISVTGLWDPPTANAVIVLQQLTGRNELGLVGPQTWSTLLD